MANKRTLDFLKTTRLALVACADENLLDNFVNCLSAINFRESEFAIKNEIGAALSGKEISQKLATAQAKEANIFVPFKCERYSKLRSIYFYLPESVKSDVQIFVLKETDAGVKLECELGLSQGLYVLYDYTKTTGRFTERE